MYGRAHLSFVSAFKTIHYQIGKSEIEEKDKDKEEKDKEKEKKKKRIKNTPSHAYLVAGSSVTYFF